MAFTEFYVTKGSAVSDVNGGGPSLGTNDGPVATRTNCSSDVGGITITDDDAGGWGAASVDDWICFDTAGTKEFTRITVVSGNDLTVSPAVTGSASGVTVNVGGAWATADNAASLLTTSLVNGSGDPPRVNIKYDAAAYSEFVVVDNSGLNTVPLTFEGYESTAGDKCPNENFPKFTAPDTSSTVMWTCFQDFVRLLCLQIDSDDAGQTGISMGGSDSDNHVIRCKVTVDVVSSTTHAIACLGLRCLILTCTASRVNSSNGGNALRSGHYGIIKGNLVIGGGNGIVCGSSVTVLNNCITGSTDGIESNSTALHADGNSIYNCTNGIRTTSSNHVILNNIVMSCTTGIVLDSDCHPSWVDFNAYYNNTTDVSSIDYVGVNEVALTGDPFTNAAGNDFTLNNTADAGAACRDAGFPGSFIDGTNIGHIDIGALRHADPAGGGGGMLVHPGTSGGARG